MADEPRIPTHRYFTKIQHAKLTKVMETKEEIKDAGIQLIDALAPPP